VPILLSQLQSGISLAGVEPDRIVQVVATLPVGESAVTLIYRLPNGGIRERLLTEAELGTIFPATAERPWSFDGDGTAFKLTIEAKRIDLAFLFDPMMAVHTSNVDPLPHQIAQRLAVLPKC
jgi:hypothetical protein